MEWNRPDRHLLNPRRPTCVGGHRVQMATANRSDSSLKIHKAPNVKCKCLVGQFRNLLSASIALTASHHSHLFAPWLRFFPPLALRPFGPGCTSTPLLAATDTRPCYLCREQSLSTLQTEGLSTARPSIPQEARLHAGIRGERERRPR